MCVAGFVLLSLAYFLVIDRWLVPRHEVPKSYRHFMLQASKPIPNRLIVESGSNAVHGIDVSMLEEATGRAAFNIADTAGYPLRHKIYRLREALKPGDLVLLPLEWNHYADSETLNTLYVDSLTDLEARNAFYYHGLPLQQKLVFAFQQLPYRKALQGSLGRALQRIDQGAGQSGVDEDLQALQDSLDQGSRGSLYANEPVPLVGLTRSMSCRGYLFGPFGDRLQVSDYFRANLELLRRVQAETGAEFIFTWPTVVTKDEQACYGEDLEPILASHAEEVAAIVADYGFRFLGHYRDAEFPKACIRDTFYHVQHDCAVERTAVLIQQLEAAGFGATGEVDGGEVEHVLRQAWSEMAGAYGNHL